jgi:hypothetical protein
MLRPVFAAVRHFVGVVFVGALIALVAGCGGSSDDTPTPVENVTVARVSVAVTSSQLVVGGTTTATATVLSNKGGSLTDRPVSWQSSDPAVATVSGSGLTATVSTVAVGNATISATAGGVTGTSAAIAIATAPDALSALAVSPTTVTLVDVGAAQAITTTPTTAQGANVSYANATSSAAIATVTATGANPTITAVGPGTAAITITATGSGAGLATKSIPKTITVIVPSVATAQLNLPKNGLLPNGKSDATLTLKSSNGTVLGKRQVTWTSSNTAVATVSGNGTSATVTAVAPGSVTITATSEGVTATSQTLLVQPLSACVELQSDANTLALYHFNEGSGQSVANATGSGRNGTLGPDLTTTNDPAWITDGKFGSALHFTRTGDYATAQYVNVNNVGATLSGNQASVELYVRPKAPYDHSNLFVAGFINFTVNINYDGRVEFGIGNGAQWQIVYADAPNLNDGNWHFLAATYDGSKMHVFFDGQERLAVASSMVLANPNDFKIGGRPQNTFLNGDLDEIRVSNVARTLSEIQSRYCP